MIAVQSQVLYGDETQALRGRVCYGCLHHILRWHYAAFSYSRPDRSAMRHHQNLQARPAPGARLLRRMAQVQSVRDAAVISLYLDLSPSEYVLPKARVAEMESLLDRARQLYTDSEEHRRLEQQPLVRQDLDRVRAYLEGDFSAGGARGVALYSCAQPELFEVVRLARPVSPSITVGPVPRLLPLLEAGPWLVGAYVLAVDRHHAYAAVARELELHEIGYLRGTPGRRFPGGSEARYQRHLEEAWKAHVRRAARLLTENVEAASIDHLVLVAPSDLLPMVEEALPDPVGGAVVGRVTADRIHERPRELLHDMEEILDQHVVDLERDLLADLEERLGRGMGAVSGVDDVLQAAYQGLIDTLALAPGFELEGWQCPSCGWLTTTLGECPVDGSVLHWHPRLGELLVCRALLQSAEVRALDAPVLAEARAAAKVRREE